MNKEINEFCPQWTAVPDLERRPCSAFGHIFPYPAASTSVESPSFFIRFSAKNRFHLFLATPFPFVAQDTSPAAFFSCFGRRLAFLVIEIRRANHRRLRIIRSALNVGSPGQSLVDQARVPEG
jgi:hypothetical protein